MGILNNLYNEKYQGLFRIESPKCGFEEVTYVFENKRFFIS
jgi:hypothetical protein